ncbi:MAG: hypothetical protein ACO1O1_09165 [Adhaeribacter sp.]
MMNEAALKTELLKRESAIASGANWFFWIAALSVLNSLLNYFYGNWNFFVGLSGMHLVDMFVQKDATLLRGLGLNLNLGAALLFCWLGLLARKRNRRAFLAGFLLYLADSLVFLLLADSASLGFHALGLFMIVGGYRSVPKAAALACRLEQVNRN